MDQYKDKIIRETILDLSIINHTLRGKKIVVDTKEHLGNGNIWVIRTWGTDLRLRSLVDFLFRYDLDVFDIEYGSITRIYICRKDDYRIKNSVVYSLRSN